MREHIEQFARELFAIQIHERQRCVSQRRGAQGVPLAMQPVGMGKVRRLVDGQRMQQHRLGIVVIGTKFGELRAQEILRLVNSIGMHRNSRVTRCAKGPEGGCRNTPVRAGAARAPHPAAVILLADYQGTGQCARAIGEPLQISGAGFRFARKLQRAHGREQIGSGKATHSRRRGDPVTTIAASLGPRGDGVAQREVDNRLLEARADGYGHPL